MSLNYSLYLAGPISGLTYEGATDWREYVRQRIDPRITCLSPLRGKDYFKGRGVIGSGDYGHLSQLSGQHGVMRRDFFDVQRAGAIFVSLLGATQVSIGTVMEMAWAYQLHKPVIAVLGPGNPHWGHLMLDETITYRTEDLDEAIWLAEQLLLPETQEDHLKRVLAPLKPGGGSSSGGVMPVQVVPLANDGASPFYVTTTGGAQ